MDTIKAAVIGTGNMGRHHVRNYTEMPGVDLVAVSDVNLPAAQEFAKEYKCRAYKDFNEMIMKEKPDVVSVVVPTFLHAKIGCEVLKHTNALVEKPIALNEKDGTALIKAARSSGHKLTIGQIERFNPVVNYLEKFCSKDDYLAFNIMRLGSYLPPSRSTGVLLDAGIHDIDLIRYLTASEPVYVHAAYRHVKITDFEDQAQVFLKMPGPSASLVCNWISPVKIRHLYAVTTKAFLYLDFANQSVVINHEDGKQETITLPKEEPLRRELDAFVEAIRKDKPAPVSGEDAMESVRIALRADAIGQKNDPHMK